MGQERTEHSATASSVPRLATRLNPDGSFAGTPPLSADQIHEALRLMLQSRAIDELAIKLQRLKRIGLYAPVAGQEATVVGSSMALDPKRDWMVPASREQPAMIRHGLPLEAFFAAYMGRPDFAAIPPGVKLLPRQQAIGAQLPQAAGLAWALKLRHERAVTMVYCGDGASSEGDFHESLNLAGVMRVPLIVLVINNQYAISVPFHKQTAAASLADRAIGYGMPGISVDGDDIFAVYAASKAAVDWALDGHGPTLIECRTYRIGFHNTSDNPSEYRDSAEVQTALESDPVGRLERFALRQDILSESDLATLKEQIRAELNSVQRYVATLPRPEPEFIFQHIYEHPPARLEQQRADLRETV